MLWLNMNGYNNVCIANGGVLVRTSVETNVELIFIDIVSMIK